MNINSRRCVISRLQLQKTSIYCMWSAGHPNLTGVTSGPSSHLYEVTWLRTTGVACLLPVQCRKSHARTPSDSGLLRGHLAFHTHWTVMSRQRHLPAFASLQNPSSSPYVDSFCPLLAPKLWAGASLFSALTLWFFCIQEGKSDFGEQFSWNPEFNGTNRCAEGLT